MPRILVLTSLFPPHHYGGYEIQCRDVVDRWRERGHEVTVLTSDHRVHGQEVDSGDAVRRELRWYWDDHKILRPSLRERLQTERHNQSVLDDVLRTFQPDAVSVWQMGAMSFGLLTTLIEREIPLVYYVVDDWLVYGRKVDPWTRLFRGSETLGRLVRRAVGIPTVTGDFSDSGFFCFVSAVTRERTERFTGWRFERNTIVPCGVSRAFEPGSARKEWGWRLYLPTRIDPRKGIATAIAALAELPHAHLVVQGRGDDSHLAELRELALSTGVSGRVEFAPFAQHSGGGSATVAAGYNGADACLFPPTWEEPFGMVPLEAMASGTPVIASGVGGSAEFLVDGENCLLFTPGDPSSLAGAVDRLASDAALRQRLVEGGLATAERFRVEHTADRLEGYVLDEIAAKVGQ